MSNEVLNKEIPAQDNAGVITVVVDGAEIRFKPDEMTYNRMINEISGDNKVAPAKNFLNRCVLSQDKEILHEALKKPGVSIKLAGLVVDEYSGHIEVFLKE